MHSNRKHYNAENACNSITPQKIAEKTSDAPNVPEDTTQLNAPLQSRHASIAKGHTTHGHISPKRPEAPAVETEAAPLTCIETPRIEEDKQVPAPEEVASTDDIIRVFTTLLLNVLPERRKAIHKQIINQARKHLNRKTRISHSGSKIHFTISRRF